jgi:hypothetical protein
MKIVVIGGTDLIGSKVTPPSARAKASGFQER